MVDFAFRVFINTIALASIVWSFVYAWLIYKQLKSRSIRWILAAFAFGGVVRLIAVFESAGAVQFPAREVQAVFYILLLLGMAGIYHAMINMKGGGDGKNS